MPKYVLICERGLEYKIVRATGVVEAFSKARDLRAQGWDVTTEAGE